MIGSNVDDMNKRSRTLLEQPRHLGQRRAVALVFIAFAALAGCDNVEWGGIQVDVKAAVFERPDSLGPPPDSLVEPRPLEMPAAPVLFHVRRSDDNGGATIEPVAETLAGELKPVGPQRAERAAEYVAEFIARYYQRDRTYTLFRDATRVGTFYVGAPAVTGAGLCLELRAEGRIELRPPADTLSEFLAFASGVRTGGDSLVTPRTRADMRSLAQVLARRSVQEAGMEGAWRIRASADLRALHVGKGSYGFAASFMVRDSLAVGAPADSAGSVLIVADYAPAIGYFPLYFDATVRSGPEARASLDRCHRCRGRRRARVAAACLR